MEKIVEFPIKSYHDEEVKNRDKPASIIEFISCRGCENCKNLVEVEEGVYICATRNKLDDKPIVPIVNDEKTSDWGFCEGEFYERNYRKASNGNRR